MWSLKTKKQKQEPNPELTGLWPEPVGPPEGKVGMRWGFVIPCWKFILLIILIIYIYPVITGSIKALTDSHLILAFSNSVSKINSKEIRLTQQAFFNPKSAPDRNLNLALILSVTGAVKYLLPAECGRRIEKAKKKSCPELSGLWPEPVGPPKVMLAWVEGMLSAVEKSSYL